MKLTNNHIQLSNFEVDFLDDIASEVTYHKLPWDQAERIICYAVRSLFEGVDMENEDVTKEVLIWFNDYYNEH